MQNKNRYTLAIPKSTKTFINSRMPHIGCNTVDIYKKLVKAEIELNVLQQQDPATLDKHAMIRKCNDVNLMMKELAARN